MTISLRNKFDWQKLLKVQRMGKAHQASYQVGHGQAALSLPHRLASPLESSFAGLLETSTSIWLQNILLLVIDVVIQSLLDY